MTRAQKYKYFHKLVLINKATTKNGGVLNIRIDDNTINELNLLLRDLYNSNEDNLDSIIKNLLFVSAYIFSCQPFFDGNTRTINLFMIKFLKEKGIHFYSSLKVKNFPIFYLEEDNYITNDDINILKQKITNL